MREPDFSYLSEFIKNYRHAHGLSLGQLAEKTTVSRSMIYQIECGKAVPTLNVVAKLAYAMGTPITSLIDPYQDNMNFHCRKAKDRARVETDGITFIPIAAESANRKLEMMEFIVDKKGTFKLKSYPAGTTEYILVQKGEISFQGVLDKVTMKKGDGVESRASIQRSLVQESAQLARGIIIRYFGCTN